MDTYLTPLPWARLRTVFAPPIQVTRASSRGQEVGSPQDIRRATQGDFARPLSGQSGVWLWVGGPRGLRVGSGSAPGREATRGSFGGNTPVGIYACLDVALTV